MELGLRDYLRIFGRRKQMIAVVVLVIRGHELETVVGLELRPSGFEHLTS